MCGYDMCNVRQIVDQQIASVVEFCGEYKDVHY